MEANSELCSASCACDADKSEWSVAFGSTMVTSPDGALRYQQCPYAYRDMANETGEKNVK